MFCKTLDINRGLGEMCTVNPAKLVVNPLLPRARVYFSFMCCFHFLGGLGG